MCTNDIPGQQVRSRVRSVPALSSLRCFTCQHHRRRCVYAVRVLRALGGGELRTAWTWAGTPWRTPIYDPRGGPQPLSMGRIRVENVGSGSQVRREHPNPLICHTVHLHTCAFVSQQWGGEMSYHDIKHVRASGKNRSQESNLAGPPGGAV